MFLRDVSNKLACKVFRLDVSNSFIKIDLYFSGADYLKVVYKEEIVVELLH